MVSDDGDNQMQGNEGYNISIRKRFSIHGRLNVVQNANLNVNKKHTMMIWAPVEAFSNILPLSALVPWRSFP